MRGCDELTVQQVLNEIGRKKDELERKIPDLHRDFGYAFMADKEMNAGAKQKAEWIETAYIEIDRLNELAADIEREAGALWDASHKQTGDFGAGTPNA
jgi:hypothetical protein